MESVDLIYRNFDKPTQPPSLTSLNNTISSWAGPISQVAAWALSISQPKDA